MDGDEIIAVHVVLTFYLLDAHTLPWLPAASISQVKHVFGDLVHHRLSQGTSFLSKGADAS